MKTGNAYVQKKGKKYSQMREIFHFVVQGKKYWLLPLIVIFALFALLLFIAETLPIISPFIYTLF